jgi:hypothetical protein
MGTNFPATMGFSGRIDDEVEELDVNFRTCVTNTFIDA